MGAMKSAAPSIIGFFHGRADVGVSAPEMWRERECFALWVSLFQVLFIRAAMRRKSGRARRSRPTVFAIQFLLIGVPASGLVSGGHGRAACISAF